MNRPPRSARLPWRLCSSAALLLVCGLVATCGPLTLQYRPEDRVRLTTADAAVTVPAASNKPACAAAVTDAPTPAVQAALTLWCEGDEATESAAHGESLRYLVRLMRDRRSGTVASLQIAPNIRLESELDAEATYLMAEEYGQDGIMPIGVLPGAGVPLVRRRDNEQEEFPNYPPEGMYDAVTVVAETRLESGDMLTVHLKMVQGPSLLQHGMADASGQAFLQLLEHVMLTRQGLSNEIRTGLVNPEEDWVHQDGIYLIEPFDPDRIPLLLIHGLKSSPLIWRDMTLKILTDPELHARYQIWHAFYPTGMPPFYSTARLRQALHEALDRYDPEGTSMARRHMAVIGHSMGGLISRILATDDTDKRLWDTIFTVPPEELNTDDKTRAFWEKVMDVHRESAIGFLGFINTPHRGSRTADSLIGQIGSALIALPTQFQQWFKRDNKLADQVKPDMQPYIMGHVPDSVRVLSPHHPLLVTLATLPLPADIEVASVVGVKKGPECLTTPGCKATDGVVEYESAHLEGVDELVIRSAHDGYHKPDTLAFMLDHLRAWNPDADAAVAAPPTP